MSDTVVILDPLARLCCPDGHVLRCFRTKDLAQPAMSLYLLHAGQLFLAEDEALEEEIDDAGGWRIDTRHAVRERRYNLREVFPRSLRMYASCTQCEPVLVRTDTPTTWGDIVSEHSLFVDFELTFRSGELLQIEHRSGTRDEFKQQLRARGAFVLEDDDPLATAHRSLRLSRARLPQFTTREPW